MSGRHFLPPKNPTNRLALPDIVDLVARRLREHSASQKMQNVSGGAADASSNGEGLARPVNRCQQTLFVEPFLERLLGYAETPLSCVMASHFSHTVRSGGIKVKVLILHPSNAF